MDRDVDDGSQATRRSYLTTGSTVLGAGLLAGCLGSGTDEETPDDDSAGDGEDEDGEPSGDDGDETDANGDDETTEDGQTDTSYTVELEPVGEVEFDSVPDTWVANNGSWADMGIALGQDPPEGVWLTSRYHTQYYDEIPGVSVDKSDMVSLSQSGEVSRELFYELDGDVHVIDPNFLLNRFDGWEQDDVDEIETNVGPFVGNTSFSTDYGWHDDYRYYSLLEAFEKLATVFQERERYEAFESVHEEFQEALAPAIPGTGDRPEAAVVWAVGDEPTEFYPYIIGSGTSFKHLRDLGVNDALARSGVKDFHGDRGAIDYETLLDVDPEVLLVRGHENKTAAEFDDTVVSFMTDHEVGSALTAVQNDDVYRAGGLYQGPITNLVLTERLASELYGVEADLFDRQRVADIVNGNV